MANNIRVLQTHFFDADQGVHVMRLLDWLNPVQCAHIVDAGSGIGEVARLMAEARPDLSFTLVNLSEYQLSLSPQGEPFTPVLADFTKSGLEPGCADVVMFNSALCQMPINQALSEARRLLKPGGALFVNDLALDQYREFPGLHAAFMRPEQWCEVIARHGFAESSVPSIEHFDIAHLQQAIDDGACFADEFPGARPFVGVFTKQAADEHVDGVIARHERIALQLSGGKDSLAVLYQLRRHWPVLTVYWVNTGDPVPEVLEVIDTVRALVPNFVEVAGRVNEQIQQHGIPSDLVPVSATPMAIAASGEGRLLQDRFNCCVASLMRPLHDKMAADGITLLIRGQKNSDKLKSPLRSGAVMDQFEYLFPIEHLTDAEVFDYLRREAFVPAYYEDLAASPDCLTCSAYWSEGRANWLKRKHPQAYDAYQDKLALIREAVMPHIALFNLETAE